MLGTALGRKLLSQATNISVIGAAVFVVALLLFFPFNAFAAETLECGRFLNPIGDCLQIGATAIVNVLVAVAGWVLYWAGGLFEATLDFSIHADYNALTAVISGWTIFRDLINILFIFILLYIAIGTVLNIGGVDWKKQVTQVIIAAILVNFSLFLTRVVIDGSNIISLGVYQQITACEASDAGNYCTGNAGRPDSITITEALMNHIGLAETFKENAFGAVASDAKDGLRNGLIRLGLITLVTWAFINVALLFIVRTVVFVILLVTSPIGVAGANLPMLKKYAGDWRSNLFSQALVAPVFLLLIYIVLKMAGDLLSGGDQNTGFEFTTTLPEDDSSLGATFWLNFVIILGFIIAGVRITKKLAGEAGKVINSVGAAILGAGLGVTVGGAALLGRQTVGRAAAQYASSQGGKDLKAAAERGERGAVWRYNALQATAKGSMDVRNSKFGKAVTDRATKLGGVAGIKASAGSKAGEGGRLKQIERAAEKKEKQLEVLSPEAKRKRADEIEARTKRGIPGLGRGAHKETANRLRKSADKQETSKEEREKRVERSAGEIRKNQNKEKEIKTILGKLKSNELRNLPPDVLKIENVVKQLKIGDMESLKGHLNRDDLEEIVNSPHLRTEVKDWVKDPEKGYM